MCCTELNRTYKASLQGKHKENKNRMLSRCSHLLITPLFSMRIYATRSNYGVPRIVIQEVVNNTLCLEHLDQATTFLDRQYANNTLMYMAEIWKHPVNLLTKDEDGREVVLTARANT